MTTFIIILVVICLVAIIVISVKHEDPRKKAIGTCQDFWQRIKHALSHGGHIQALAWFIKIDKLCKQHRLEPKDFISEKDGTLPTLREMAEDAEHAFLRWPGSRPFWDQADDFHKTYIGENNLPHKLRFVGSMERSPRSLSDAPV